MKKWQKTGGIVAFGAIGIYELLLWFGAYLDLKYIVEPYNISVVTERMYLRIDSLSLALWFNYFIALAIFICLWRKDYKLTLSNIDRLKKTLQNLGVANSAFYVDDICHADSTVLFKSGNEYQIIYVDDRGVQKVIASFLRKSRHVIFCWNISKNRQRQVRKTIYLNSN